MGNRKRNAAIAALAIAMAVGFAAPALAQSSDPFATAEQAACSYQQGLVKLCGAVGMLGMVSALLLGYFNLLNWKWIATCIGVCFAVNVAPAFVMGLAGGSCH